MKKMDLFKVNMPTSVIKAIEPVLKSGYIADGENVTEFEKSLGSFIGNTKVVTVHSEANGILLSLFMAGVRPGDEVIASPVACVASTMPILNLFAKVRWCDVNPDTGMIDPGKIEPLISNKTKAILHTHWSGEVGEVSIINKIAHDNGLKVIEDASEAFGAKFQGNFLGNQDSDFTVFSFGPIKHITTTDGGAIFFKDEHEYIKAIDLKRFGIHQKTFRDDLGEICPKSDIPLQGYNFYMNNVCAAIGFEQLKRASDVLKLYYENGSFYKKNLSDVGGISMLKRNDKNKPSFWTFTLLAKNRGKLLKALRSQGIYASKIHMRNDIYSCFGTGVQKHLEGVNYFSEHELCIPCGWWIGKEEREEIINAILSASNKSAD